MFLTELQTSKCIKILENKERNSKFNNDLIKFINTKYNVEAITVFIKKDKNKKHIIIVLRTQADFNVFVKSAYSIDSIKQKEISREFIRLYNKSNILKKIDDVWVSFESFEDQIKTNLVLSVLSKINNEDKEYLESMNIWCISAVTYMPTIFYFTKKDCEESNVIGSRKIIEEHIMNYLINESLYKYIENKEINYFYDSKEVVDKEYEGNLYYYFK